MSEDFTAQANRAATELLHELDLTLPVESYTLLHSLAALAYGKGCQDGIREAVEAHKTATEETLAVLRAEERESIDVTVMGDEVLPEDTPIPIHRQDVRKPW